MHFSHARSLQRIDHDRRSLHGMMAGRLTTAVRDRADAGEAIKRLAFVAYLRGMRRQVLDCSQATGRDARVSHLLLSREQDEEKERDWLLWLIAFLGLPWHAIELQRYRAQEAARNAAQQMRSATLRRAERAAARIHEAASGTTGTPGDPRGTSAGTRPQGLSDAELEQLRQDAARRPIRPATATEPVTSWLEPSGATDVASSIPADLIDLWAETVAYTQYERGRHDAGKHYPAVRSALWGYRWSSELDTRTTVGCRLLDGWVAPASDSWMQALAPPRHFNCRSLLIPVWQSSRLRRPPTSIGPRVSEATLNRYLEQKQDFLRRLV